MARRIVGNEIKRPGRLHGDPDVTISIAKDLHKVPGNPIRDGEVSFFSREYPLESMAIEQSASADWAADIRNTFSPETTELYEEHKRLMEPTIEWIKSTGDLEPSGTPTGENVTDAIRHKARELGYGEIGFTKFDRRYAYESRRPQLKPLPHAICLALEQDYESTQNIPSLESEEAHGETYVRQAALTRELVDFILSLGYRVQVSGPTWHYAAMIPMFVEAGLGQLGINGQLLSPHFGSRARLQIILTDAKVNYDRPIDYGIVKYCEFCQICSIRCPGRAIQANKFWYRGVEKSKLIFKRCRPIMARYAGCGICMKVCPIQRYGLKPVMEHYIETGEVLGKGTDNLEGYTLPDKGYFAAGKLPHFSPEFFEMPLGRAEDVIMDEFKDKLESVNGSATAETEEQLWDEFRHKLEDSIKRRSVPVDMGMDF